MRWLRLFFWLVPASLWGQSDLQLQWRVPSASEATLSPEGWPSTNFPLSDTADRVRYPPSNLLPSYARQNPTGFSFLCRQELAIQRRWPVALWVDMEDNPTLKGQIMTTPHLRLQVPLK